MPDVPDAFIAHSIVGRLRLKIPSRRGDGAYLKKIAEEFSSLPGIEQVTVNPETSSILFLHGLEKEMIMRHLSGSGLFQLSPSPVAPASLHRGVESCFREVSGKIENVTGGTLGASELAFLALLGAGGIQITRGNLTAIPWYAAFWYAFNIFLKSDRQKKEGE